MPDTKTLFTLYLIEPLSDLLSKNPYGVVGVFIIALLGLAFSMPSLFQAIWGRPEIKIELLPRPGDQGFNLAGRFYTPEVKSKILRFLGVHKPHIPLLFFSEMNVAGTNESIYTRQAYKVHTRDSSGFHGTIGPEPVTFVIGEIREEGEPKRKIKVIWVKFGENGQEDTWNEAAEGKYKLSGRVRYWVDFILTFEVEFVVNEHGFRWENNSLKITRQK